MTEHVRRVWAEVDLSAIRHNVALLQNVAGVPVMAVVKADGYGHGAPAVAAAAVEAGVAMLGVALIEEGLALRQAGVGAPILVLSEPPPASSSVCAIANFDLTPTVYSRPFIDALPRGTRVHLKVDTGMHRVGCESRAARALARAIHARGLHLEGVYTHLAIGEQPDHPATIKQLACFDQTVEQLARAGLGPAVIHAANSAAAIGLPASRYGMVRCGIATYGIVPAPGVVADPGLRPALSLRAEVSFVKRVRAGEGLSYGHTYETAHDSYIATVPIGYGDGYTRRLSGVAHAHWNGRLVPIAGTITMDQLLLDCGDDQPQVGDLVELIGPHVRAETLAGQSGTIAYEIVTALGPRVPRTYIE